LREFRRGSPEFHARATLARIDAGEGAMPGEVVALIINDGLTPVAAWRRHRGLTQSDLAVGGWLMVIILQEF
jgi:hypothetical protein